MSARRIRAYDHDLRPSRVVPQRPVDFGTIDSDVRNALKYCTSRAQSMPSKNPICVNISVPSSRTISFLSPCIMK
jgi:hypothetical protein